MKKILLFILVMCCIGMQAQSYYSMFTDEQHSAGNGEYICNLGLSTSFNPYGIQFVSNKKTRGFLTDDGKWFFFRPATLRTTQEAVQSLKNVHANTSIISDGTIRCEEICLQGFPFNPDYASLRVFANGTYNCISSANDTDGLYITSTVGKKVKFFANKVYFNEKNWAYFGTGRNDCPVIVCENKKFLRFGSPGGFGFWSDGKINENDNPNVRLNERSFDSNLPFNVNEKNISIATKSHADTCGWIGTTTAHGLYVGTKNLPAIYIGDGQNIFMGLNRKEALSIRADLKNIYNVFVKKGILAADYSIAPVDSWSDYVFGDSYELPSLQEVEQYIQDNKHLPDVPSQQEVSKSGYSQHEMNKTLLKKIEELTLYVIQLEKEIEHLKTEK